MAKLDEKKVRVYEVILNMFWKSAFSGVSLWALIYVLIKYCEATTEFDTYKYGAIEAILVSTVFLAYRHYFPKKGKDS